MLSDQIKGKIDALMDSEIKIDDSFPNVSFLIDGFRLYRSKPYRLDRID